MTREEIDYMYLVIHRFENKVKNSSKEFCIHYKRITGNPKCDNCGPCQKEMINAFKIKLKEYDKETDN